MIALWVVLCVAGSGLAGVERQRKPEGRDNDPEFAPARNKYGGQLLYPGQGGPSGLPLGFITAVKPNNGIVVMLFNTAGTITSVVNANSSGVGSALVLVEQTTISTGTQSVWYLQQFQDAAWYGLKVQFKDSTACTVNWHGFEMPPLLPYNVKETAVFNTPTTTQEEIGFASGVGTLASYEIVFIYVESDPQGGNCGLSLPTSDAALIEVDLANGTNPNPIINPYLPYDYFPYPSSVPTSWVGCADVGVKPPYYFGMSEDCQTGGYQGNGNQCTLGCGPWSAIITTFPEASNNNPAAAADLTLQSGLDISIYGAQSITLPPSASVALNSLNQYGNLTLGAGSALTIQNSYTLTGTLTVDSMAVPIQIGTTVSFQPGSILHTLVSAPPDPKALELTYVLMNYNLQQLTNCAPNCLSGLLALELGSVIPNFQKKRGNNAVLSGDGTQQCVSQFGQPGVQWQGSALSVLVPVQTTCAPVPSISVPSSSTLIGGLPYWAIIVIAVGGFLLLLVLATAVMLVLRSVRKRRMVDGAEAKIKDVQAQLERSRTADDFSAPGGSTVSMPL
jgi:hypothetical protein